MSAPQSDLMGNAITEPIVEDDDFDVEINVVDDRPEEDKRSESQADDFDPEGEIPATARNAKTRIQKLKFEYHEQRRNKEAAERMREEAVHFADGLARENRDLKELLHRGEKVLLSEIKARADSDLTQARDQYKTAYDAGDTDALLKAQEGLTRSQYESAIAERTAPAVPPPPRQPQMMPRRQVAPPIDPKLQGWLQNNEWFGQDQELTSFAYGVHEKLVSQDGVDPRSDSYYEKLDKRLHEVFPDKFGDETFRVGMGTEEPSASPRTNTVVAPAGRSSGRPRKVQLTSTQVALAKRLGITPEQYAKQLLKEYSSG